MSRLWTFNDSKPHCTYIINTLMVKWIESSNTKAVKLHDVLYIFIYKKRRQMVNAKMQNSRTEHKHHSQCQQNIPIMESVFFLCLYTIYDNNNNRKMFAFLLLLVWSVDSFNFSFPFLHFAFNMEFSL